MKATEIRDLSIEDINEKLAETIASYEKMRINHKVAQLESPIDLRHMRKNIARYKTVLKEKQTQQ